MTTRRKKWPHVAEWCRCDCIAIAEKGRREFMEIIEDVNDPVILRRIAKSIDYFREIETKLRSVGSQNDEGENNG